MSHEDLGFIRTHLANERTLLAYVRTSLAFMAGGAGLVHFMPFSFSLAVGWTLITVGGVVLTVGIVRFVYVRQRINKHLAEKVAGVDSVHARRC